MAMGVKVVAVDREEMDKRIAEMNPMAMILDALECRIGYALRVEGDPGLALCYIALLERAKEEMRANGADLSDDEHRVRRAEA